MAAVSLDRELFEGILRDMENFGAALRMQYSGVEGRNYLDMMISFVDRLRVAKVENSGVPTTNG